jgi:transposase
MGHRQLSGKKLRHPVSISDIMGLKQPIPHQKGHRMLIKTILNQVTHYQSFVYGAVKLVQNGGQQELHIAIHPRRNSRAVCSGCGRPGSGYDILAPRQFEFIPFWGILVYFVYAMRRVDCPRCGITVEQVPWSQGKSPITTAYGWFLAGWARRMSWSEVASAFRTSWHTVFSAVEMAVTWGRDHRDLSGITAIGVDEIQWGRGHRYLTVVYQINEGARRLLWVGEKRTAKTLLRFFRWLGQERTAQLEFVCSDMWKAYLKVIAKKAAQAIHILDRFHIMTHLSKAIDEVRAGESKELVRRGYEPVLKKTRWLLLKRPENLKDTQQASLAELLRYNLKTVRCYLLKEQFQLFWEYASPHWAGVFLDKWCTKTMRSRIEPMQKVARMLRNHRDLILNWFRARKAFSSGIVEGLNTKAKLTTRKAYGFKSFKMLEVALYHNLAKLPEPVFTHRFF